MPRRCSVAGCRSNYDTEKEYTTTFSIPKNETLRSQWLKNIPTDLSRLKNPMVCIKHFPETSIIREDCVIVKGELKKYPRENPKYAENAVPCIFPNLPSSTPSSVKRLANKKKECLDYAIAQSVADHKEYKREHSISSVDDILKYLKQCNEKQECWAIFKKQDKLALCCMKTDIECPVVSACIIIEQNLDFTVYVNNIKINESNLPHVGKITCQKILEDLLLWAEANKNPDDKSLLDNVVSQVKSFPNYEESKNLQFLVEQLILSVSPKYGKRYTNQSMLFASCLYVLSRRAYYALMKSGLLHLPHPKKFHK